MATPESKPPEQPEAKPKKGTGPAVKPGKGKQGGKRIGKKSARQIAVELLKKAGGQMKFGELVKKVSDRMGGKLTWTPTYYLKSPGFSKPERGMVAYSEADEKKGREAMITKRRANLEKARGARKAKGKKGGKVGKGQKKETVLERRERTAREKAAKEAQAKAEFDAAAAEAQKKA